MKVTGPAAPATPTIRRSTATAKAGFAGGAAATSTAAPARAVGMPGVTSLDALLALQEVDGPLERRRRSVARAGRILDGLDRLKLSLLDGGLSPTALSELASAVRDGRAATDDPRLEGVLDEIETRAAVELAKAELARAA